MTVHTAQSHLVAQAELAPHHPDVYRRRKPSIHPLHAEALYDINELLIQRGRPPLERLPKGRRKAVKSCPIGRALGALVGPTSIFMDGEPVFLPPLSVTRFVVAFDKGLIPELVEP